MMWDTTTNITVLCKDNLNMIILMYVLKKYLERIGMKWYKVTITYLDEDKMYPPINISVKKKLIFQRTYIHIQDNNTPMIGPHTFQNSL